jgi:soluble lytic murein transglycosylase-like protein
MRTTLVAVSLLICAAAPARAELVYFEGGRSLSVKAYRVDGDSLVLTLRSGGEIVCDRSVIVQIAPDEVPYPEPEVAVKADEVRPDADAGADTRYADIIDRVSSEQGVPARLVRAVIQVESAYNARARSRKGAMGLMQLMPETARQYQVADPYDPRANIEAGVKHLKGLLERFPRTLALAAYNAGEAAVQRFQGIPPYGETRNYVLRILQLAGL